MVKARNEIIHIYDEDLANDISLRIVIYSQVLGDIAKMLETRIIMNPEIRTTS